MSHQPPSGEAFEGVIGKTIAESKPWWPPARFKAGAPDVVMVVLDDTGFAHLGCYGSTIETLQHRRPGGRRAQVHRLSHHGALLAHSRLLAHRPQSPCRGHAGDLELRYRLSQHARGAAALGRHPARGPAARTATPPSRPANGTWPPMAECSAAGPFTNWPLQKGFDRYYGFLQGETDQFFPELTSDNHFVDPPAGPEEGYHVSEDLVDRSAGMIGDLASLVPERPFFLYLAFGAMHLAAPDAGGLSQKYRGRFDAGWDVAREAWFARQKAMGVVPAATRLAPPNPGVKPWSELSADERKFAARLQEAFAFAMRSTASADTSRSAG